MWQLTQPACTTRFCYTSPYLCVVRKPGPAASCSACSLAFLSLHPFCLIGNFLLLWSMQEPCLRASGPFCCFWWVKFVVDCPKLALHIGLIWSLAVFVSVMLFRVVIFSRKWNHFYHSWQRSHCWYCNSMLWWFNHKFSGPLPCSSSPLPSSCSYAGVVLTVFSENICTRHPSKRGISWDKGETTVGGSAQGWSEDSRYNSWDHLFPNFTDSHHWAQCHSMKFQEKYVPIKIFLRKKSKNCPRI